MQLLQNQAPFSKSGCSQIFQGGTFHKDNVSLQFFTTCHVQGTSSGLCKKIIPVYALYCLVGKSDSFVMCVIIIIINKLELCLF